jgi:hypothetical protein
LATVLLASGTGCRSSIDAFGANPAYARHAAENTFAAMAFRFYEVQRDSNFNRSRNLMGQYALIPSRLFRDSTLWNVFPPDSSRTLLVGATFTGNHYTFTANRQAPHPRARRPAPCAQPQVARRRQRMVHHGRTRHRTATPAAIGAVIMASTAAEDGR